MQYFQYYSYRHITFQYMNQEVCGYYVDKYSLKICFSDQATKYILCKGTHKVWNQSCLFNKEEIEQISLTYALISYKYPIKSITNRSAKSCHTKDKEVFGDYMIIRPNQLSTNIKNTILSSQIYSSRWSSYFPTQPKKTTSILVSFASKNYPKFSISIAQKKPYTGNSQQRRF